MALNKTTTKKNSPHCSGTLWFIFSHIVNNLKTLRNSQILNTFKQYINLYESVIIKTPHVTPVLHMRLQRSTNTVGKSLQI